MLKTRLVPIALSGALLASPLVLAEEAHHPEQGAPGEEASQDAAASSGMMMGGPGMMGKGMGRGGMMHQGMKGDRRMMGKHLQVLNRLDWLEARLVKIEAMLEWLMQR